MNAKSFNYTENTTLEEWLRYWLCRYKLATIKDTTRDDYITTIERHIVPFMGSVPLSELNADIIQQFINSLYENGNILTGKSLSNKSVSNMKNMLNSALQKAVDLDYIPKNPVNAVEIKRAVKPEITVLERKDEEILEEGLEENNFSGKYDMAIYLALKLGLRNGEAAALMWKDIDFADRTIHIRRRVKRVKNMDSCTGAPRTILQVAAPKSKESVRDIPFNSSFGKTLRDYTERKSVGGEHRSEYIFLSDTGGVADPTTINNYFKRRLLDFEIMSQDLHFHCLRHTFATRAIEKNVDIKTLSAILGHTSVQFTLDRYAHVLSDQKRKTMELILA